MREAGAHALRRVQDVRQATVSLVPLRLDACPSCDGVLDVEHVTQGVLLRHGGYGAERRTSTVHCVCGWSLLREVSEQRPTP